MSRRRSRRRRSRRPRRRGSSRLGSRRSARRSTTARSASPPRTCRRARGSPRSCPTAAVGPARHHGRAGQRYTALSIKGQPITLVPSGGQQRLSVRGARPVGVRAGRRASAAAERPPALAAGAAADERGAAALARPADRRAVGRATGPRARCRRCTSTSRSCASCSAACSSSTRPAIALRRAASHWMSRIRGAGASRRGRAAEQAGALLREALALFAASRCATSRWEGASPVAARARGAAPPGDARCGSSSTSTAVPAAS